MHHLGNLGISGNADERDGMHFTDERGRALEARGRPVAPEAPVHVAAHQLGIPSGKWSHPTGERLDPHWVHFNEPVPRRSACST
jgi:hypothetical protein